jgi:hypothetical protein
MREIIGIGIVVISTYLFGVWGFLSLFIALPFIGWQDRHKGPFPTNNNNLTTDYDAAINIQEDKPKSFRFLQDILVKASKSQELDKMLNDLVSLLKEENEINDNLSEKEILTDFISKFSSVFPNWKKEYEVLENIIDEKY